MLSMPPLFFQVLKTFMAYEYLLILFGFGYNAILTTCYICDNKTQGASVFAIFNI